MRQVSFLAAVILLVSAVGLPVAVSGDGGRAAPVANAGADQNVNTNVTVYFSGSGSSDPDSDPLTYSWDFDRSNGVQQEASGVNASHKYTQEGVYRVTLTVSDGTLFDTDECNITVVAAGTNHPPTAVISSPGNGDVSQVMQPVYFDGANSTDPDNDVLAYTWDFGDATPVGTGKRVYHSYQNAGVYQINFTVNDSKLAGTAQVWINIIKVPGPGDVNTPPRSDAGVNQTAWVGWTVVLTSFSRDPQNDKLDYYWDFDASNGINFIRPDGYGKTCETLYNQSDNYTVTHWVVESNTTEKFRSAPDTCWINVSDIPHLPPQAEAGPNRTAEVNKEVTLSGSGKVNNEGSRITRFEWDFENDGVYDWQSSTTGSAKHIYTSVGTLVAKLRVTDEANATATDTTYVTVTAKPNVPPVANAGEDQTVFAGVPVSYRGAGTDSDGQIVKYQWDFEGDGVWDYEGTTGSTSRDFSNPGTYTGVLRVTDDRDMTSDDSVVITVILNAAPVANAGGDQSVNCGEPVMFDGTASRDPEGQKMTYSWDFDDRNGLQSDASGPQADHTYTRGGEYTVTLTVTDELGKTGKDTGIITVTQTAGVSLASSPKSRTLKPGEEGAFTITIQNSGNGKDSFSLLLTGENYRWGSLDRADLTLEAGSSTTVSLRIAPPVDATANGKAAITVRAVSAFDSAVSAQTQVSATASQLYSLSATIDKSKYDVQEGKSVSFQFRVTNGGNGDDRVKLLASGAAAKWVTFTPTQSIVARGAMKSVAVKIEVPSGQAAQDYQLTITAVSQDNATQSAVVLTITVTKSGTTFIPGAGTLCAFAAAAVATVIFVARKKK